MNSAIPVSPRHFIRPVLHSVHNGVTELLKLKVLLGNFRGNYRSHSKQIVDVISNYSWKNCNLNPDVRPLMGVYMMSASKLH